MSSQDFEERVQDLLEGGIANGAHKGGFALYGNFKEEARFFQSAGYAKPRSHYKKNTIIRFASQSKILGGFILAKAIEEGFINLTDPIYNYVPEFGKPLEYFLEDGNVSPTKFDGKQILVSHLLSMSTGLGYYFASWGNIYKGLNGATGLPPLPFAEANRKRNEAINAAVGTELFWDWQFDPRILKKSQALGFKLPSMKKYIGVLTSVPLLFKPGTNSLRNVCYGMDYDVLGAVVNVAINRKTGLDVWSFFKKYFLDPMDIHSFFQIGNPDKPADLKKRLAQTAFRRPKDNKQADGTSFAPDPSPEYLDQNAGKLAWTSDYPNDGFGYNESLFTEILVENDPYQGYFGAGYGGTPYDYSKFFELLFGKGVFRCVRILSENSVKFLTTPSLPEYISFGLEFLNKKGNLGVNNFLSDSAGAENQALLAVGYNESWCAGCCTGNGAFVDALYNTSNNTISATTLRWGSYYGTNYLFDWETGNYVMSGVQEDANSLKLPPPPASNDNSGAWAGTIFAWLQEGQLNNHSDDCCKSKVTFCHATY